MGVSPCFPCPGSWGAVCFRIAQEGGTTQHTWGGGWARASPALAAWVPRPGPQSTWHVEPVRGRPWEADREWGTAGLVRCGARGTCLREYWGRACCSLGIGCRATVEGAEGGVSWGFSSVQFAHCGDLWMSAVTCAEGCQVEGGGWGGQVEQGVPPISSRPQSSGRHLTSTLLKAYYGICTLGVGLYAFPHERFLNLENQQGR